MGFRLEAQPGRSAPFGAADGDEAVSPTPLGEARRRGRRDNDPEDGMRRREELTGEISLTSRCPTAGRYTISGFQRWLFLRGLNTSARVSRIAVLTLLASMANSRRCSLILLPFARNSPASCRASSMISAAMSTAACPASSMSLAVVSHASMIASADMLPILSIRSPAVISRTSLPHSERFLESSFTGCALLDCQDRTPAIVIDDWNIEPGSAIEQFSIPLYILFGRRKADKEHPGGYLHVGDRERRTARLFRLLQ